MSVNISVITPVFNGEKYLRECIESVRSQAGVSVEHIIVDDGSTDETPKIVAEYPHVQYYYQENSGANIARNFGLSLAKGEYVKFLDADDVLIEGALQAQFLMANSLSPSEIGFGYSIAMIEGEGEHIRRPNITSGDTLDKLILNNIVTSLSLYPKSCLDIVNGFSRDLHARQEWDLNLRIVASGKRFVFFDVLVYKQRFHDSPARISNRNLDANKELAALDKVYANFPKPVPEHVNDAWAAYLWGVGRQLIYHGNAKSANLAFEKALAFSPKKFEKHLGWKYRAAKKLMGSMMPDLIFRSMKNSLAAAKFFKH